MKRLMSLCIQEVVKLDFDLGHAEIPRVLLSDVHSAKEDILMNMRGQNYFHYSEKHSVEFDICFNGGWLLSLREASGSTSTS